MTTSDSQKRFNQYPVKAFKRDIWHGCSKEEKRNSATALTYSFLLAGGQITKAPPAKKRKGGRAEIFNKDTRAVKAHEHWNKKFLPAMISRRRVLDSLPNRYQRSPQTNATSRAKLAPLIQNSPVLLWR
jgi:hypothetical protein